MWIVPTLGILLLLLIVAVVAAIWFFVRRRSGPDPVSIILLIESARLLTREHIDHALREAEIRAAKLAEEKTSYFRLWVNGFELTIAGAPIPYAKEHLSQVQLVRVREAVEAHEACILLDVWSAPPGLKREDAMPIMGKLAAALVDETALAVYQWPSQRINLITEELLESFRRGEVVEAMVSMNHDELVMISSEDERLQAAVAKAREDWPQFVEAWRAAEDKSQFLAKFPFGEEFVEYMWVEPETITDSEVTGKLLSDPHRVRGLKPGQTVTVNLADLNDWMYLEASGERVGGYTVEVLGH